MDESADESADETVQERLRAYAALVRKWAPRVNLIAAGDLGQLEARHIEDSLRALPLVVAAPEGPAIDVGAGAGLPGVPLAIADPSRHWRMLEPRSKRAAFLEEVARELGLTYEVVRLTAQEAAHDRAFAGVHAVATARALAPPEDAAALLRPLLAEGGVGILFLGAGAELPPGARHPSARPARARPAPARLAPAGAAPEEDAEGTAAGLAIIGP